MTCTRCHMCVHDVVGAFSTSGGGGLLRSSFNPKNHHFSDDFPVIFWYIHIMLLH